MKTRSRNDNNNYKKPPLSNLLSLTFLCLSFFSVLSWSGNFDKGVTAYEKGDYKTALREWTPLVEKGDALAQVKMSASYVLGQVVLKEYVYANVGKYCCIKWK